MNTLITNHKTFIVQKQNDVDMDYGWLVDLAYWLFDD